MSKESVLSISRQCELFELARSTYYYTPEPVSDEELELMRLIDQCYLELPFYGTRRIKDWLLDNHDLVVNRKRIQRLRRLLADRNAVPQAQFKLGQSSA